MIDIDKKTIIVTGCSSGIGLAVARKYFEKGFNVIGIDYDKPPDDYFCVFFQADISNEKMVGDCFRQITATWPQINYLINSAGIFLKNERLTIEEMDINEWNSVLTNNITGNMLVIKHTIPLLKESNGDRAIVNIVSDQVYYPRKKNGAYSCSKAGLENLSKTCAVELLEYRIRVNSVAPASVRSNFINKLFTDEELRDKIYEKENKRMPLGIIEPEDVADLVFFLGSPLAKKITGQSIMINSGLYLGGQ